MNHWVEWIDATKTPFPLDREGFYLVWLSRKIYPLRTSFVFKTSNNRYIQIIGDNFAHDVLDKEVRIVAWAVAPDKEETETDDGT
jgi:hypothetical protein